jgi:predicted metal-dependent HD superfamily phosphohydrolase
MRLPVLTNDSTAVAGAVQAAYLEAFADGDRMYVPRIFSWAVDCFTGQWEDYQPVDARYHDFEHTMQGTLCMARLLRARQLAGAEPALPRRMFELGLLAILFHDTGYLKKKDDVAGTGAKYTVIHVRRSADFAADFLAKKRLAAAEIRSVQNMILCTGFNAPLHQIPFQGEPEKIAGYALGTADLLGQMAAADYVDKLPVLYAEFAEAARYSRDANHPVTMFSSAADLRRKTPEFWETYVRPKLEKDFGGLHRFLNDPYPSGPNEYVERVEANIERLRSELAAA